MVVFKCKMCGGNLEVKDGMSVCKCEYCGSEQTVPTLDNEKKINLFARANRLRLSCEFDKAAGVYESIVTEFQEEAEAYWGLVLCKYGIEYVDDPKTGNKIPTCHRSSFDSIFEDSNFDMVMEYSDAMSKLVYREEAKIIEKIREGIVAVSSKEEPYDIFICYKETDDNGDRTLDSVLAQDVYNALVEKGYKVFFSRISLEDKLGQEYEPYIFAALNSAKIMLAFGTTYDYYNSVWVKNEWSRFLKLIEKGEKKTLIPCYKNIDAYDMPIEFKKLQAQNLGKVGAIQDLIHGINKIIGNEKEVVETITTTKNGLIRRGYLYLEDRDYDKAFDYFEKALDENPEDSDAYIGKVLAYEKVQNLNELEEKQMILELMPDYMKAIRFAKDENKNTLKNLLDRSNKIILYNKELAQKCKNADINEYLKLAPELKDIVVKLNIEEEQYEYMFDMNFVEVYKLLGIYEVYRILEESSEPKEVVDIINQSSILHSLKYLKIETIFDKMENDGLIAQDSPGLYELVTEEYKKRKKEEEKERIKNKIETSKNDLTKIEKEIENITLEIKDTKCFLIQTEEEKINKIKQIDQEIDAEMDKYITIYDDNKTKISELIYKIEDAVSIYNNLGRFKKKLKTKIKKNIISYEEEIENLQYDNYCNMCNLNEIINDKQTKKETTQKCSNPFNDKCENLNDRLLKIKKNSNELIEKIEKLESEYDKL